MTELLEGEAITIDAPGYIIVYVNNNSIGKDVYFDNIKIEHYAGTLLEENHYYPYGLTVSQAASGATAPLNDMKFQSQLQESGLGLNTYSFKWREHDPQIGRFWQVDPLADKYVHNSTYAFSENKVTGHIELEGLEAIPITAIPRVVPAAGASSAGAGATITVLDELDQIKAHQQEQQLEAAAEKVMADAVNTVIDVAPVIADKAGQVLDKIGEALGNMQHAASEIKVTSRAARREAMRQGGVPTSQPLVQDKKTKSKDKVYLSRDGEYTVQDAKNDESHQNEPHWEAGRTKEMKLSQTVSGGVGQEEVVLISLKYNRLKESLFISQNNLM